MVKKLLESIKVTFQARPAGRSSNAYTGEITVDIPDRCPHCGKTSAPLVLNAITTDSNVNMANVGVLLKCMAVDCRKYFVSQYTNIGDKWTRVIFSYNPPIDIDIPQNIVELSPEFANIYEQSVIAENHGLDKIDGVAYRKAAEFLYKDYAIKRHPNDEDKIKKMFLKQVIQKYMNEYPKIQNLALSVAYLGNDETHYERRNTDRDLQDLKRFLNSSIKIIDADLDVDESLEFNQSSDK